MNPRSIPSGIRNVPAASISDVLLHIGLSEPSVQRVEQPCVETSDDLLNYSGLAEVVANMLGDSRMLPLSVGISGGWGTGKSSMLKLIEAKLQAANLEIAGARETGIAAQSRRRFVVVHYDAWLYQGFDDARAALMETIAACLVIEAENKPKSVSEMALSLFRRVDKLRVLGAVADGALI